MTNLATVMNPAAVRLYRQAVRKQIGRLLNDPLVTGPERVAGNRKLEEPGVPLETLEKRRDKLVEILNGRRVATRLDD
jgi:hypothetical protein